VQPFEPLDRAGKKCAHEPGYQMRGSCLRCGIVISLEGASQAAGTKPFHPLDRVGRECAHEPGYQMQGICLRCGKIVSMAAFRG
jgi:rRNA maturation protein Nop10